jgi:hypothetical protein
MRTACFAAPVLWIAFRLQRWQETNMKAILLFGFFAALGTCAQAQTAIPAGTILPVELNSPISLNSRPGQAISARVMQNIPLPGRATIHAGAKVLGAVTAVTPASNRTRLTIRFDKLAVNGETVPLHVDLRAIASFMDVEAAQIPTTGADRGTPDTVWTTVLIGGDVDYRGGEAVTEKGVLVGRPVSDGVLSKVTAAAEGPCRGAIDGNDQPQALWVFSSDACGAYGLPGLTIEDAGRTSPTAEIVLESASGKLKIPSGSGMLLRVTGSSSSAT